uniref:WD repeat-containing protein 89 n=1 Tax=Setaria digitata TaxID=48799 RepID=A0A915PDL9_9BILA
MRRIWNVAQWRNSFLSGLKIDVHETFLACVTNGATGCALYGSFHDDQLQMLGETTSRIVRLDYCATSREALCVDESGHIWRYDPRGNRNRIHIPPAVYGLNQGSSITAASQNTDSYYLAIASQLSKTLAKKHKKRNIQRNLNVDSDDSEDSNFAIHLLDIRKMNAIIRSYSDFHSDTVQALNFSRDNSNLLISGGADGLVNFVDCSGMDEENELQSTHSILSSVNSVDFLTSNRAYATTDDGLYTIFTLNSAMDIDMSCSRKFARDGQFLVDILDTAHPDSLFLLGSSSQGEGSIHCVSNDGKEITFVDSFVDHEDLIRCCAYDPVHNILITGGDDGQIVCRHLLQYPPKLAYSSKHIKKIKTAKKNKNRKPY